MKQRARDVPKFVTATSFYREHGLYCKVGNHLIELAILVPNGILNGRPIFLADRETHERARVAVAQWRASKPSPSFLCEN